MSAVKWPSGVDKIRAAKPPAGSLTRAAGPVRGATVSLRRQKHGMRPARIAKPCCCLSEVIKSSKPNSIIAMDIVCKGERQFLHIVGQRAVSRLLRARQWFAHEDCRPFHSLRR